MDVGAHQLQRPWISVPHQLQRLWISVPQLVWPWISVPHQLGVHRHPRCTNYNGTDIHITPTTVAPTSSVTPTTVGDIHGLHRCRCSHTNYNGTDIHGAHQLVWHRHRSAVVTTTAPISTVHTNYNSTDIIATPTTTAPISTATPTTTHRHHVPHQLQRCRCSWTHQLQRHRHVVGHTNYNGAVVATPTTTCTDIHVPHQLVWHRHRSATPTTTAPISVPHQLQRHRHRCHTNYNGTDIGATPTTTAPTSVPPHQLQLRMSVLL